MSRHTIELPMNCGAGTAYLNMGFEILPLPHYFCTLVDTARLQDAPVWSSLTSLEHLLCECPDEYDEVLASFGIVIPEFIKKALLEDWAKCHTGCDYLWQQDGTFEQSR